MCVMNAGYSAGWCSVAFNLDLCSSEVLCKAKGNQNVAVVLLTFHQATLVAGL